MKKITISTNSRTEFVDITQLILEQIKSNENGMVMAYCPHTTAGLTINEGADPAVKRDIMEVLNTIIPWSFDYKHLEGNSPAHIKASLIGQSVNLMVEDGELCLGTWQRIFFCEFDGPRTRSVWIRFIG